MSSVDPQSRVLAGMLPTGRIHLGHYNGILKNWLELQHQYDCFFFIADWHALTTNYEETSNLENQVYDMFVDMLAIGINPGIATLFIQSRIPEHAELHLLLSMITPLSWLERIPGFKNKKDNSDDKNRSTYGFLGYPLLQSADILACRAGQVPTGSNQKAHIEITREIARRFNHLYGHEPDFEENAEAAIRKMGKKAGNLYITLRKRHLEQDDKDALNTAKAILKEQSNITLGDQERLFGYLKGTGKVILPEPQELVMPKRYTPGIDGQKMSNSYDNIISLRETPSDINTKLRKMPTDFARVRRNDPGDPNKCPVWKLHEIYSDDEKKQWVLNGCQSASIGCIDCKKPLIEAIQAEIKPIRDEILELQKTPDVIKNIIAEGCEVARDEAQDTLREVKNAIGIDYR